MKGIKGKMESKERIEKALDLIFQYGQIDGEHHKTWVIDQVARILLDSEYEKWIEKYEYDEEEDEYYDWDIGIAP